MELRIQITFLLLTGFLHLYSCKKCQQEDILVYNCTNLALTDLPNEKLGHVYKLDLSHNEITTLKNDSFLDRNLVDIGILYIQDNKLTTIEINAFRGMRELDFLNLNNNDLVEIPADLFKWNIRLRFLRFENNTRLKLPQEGFNLPELNILDLERCGLEAIPPAFFRNMKDLEILYLRGNRLSYIEPNSIKHLYELEFLDLRDNLFTKVQLEILRMPLVFKVSYVGNPLHCDCSLLRAYSLYKKKAPFEHLSCINDNNNVTFDLSKLGNQLNCYSSTTAMPSTQVYNVTVTDIANQDDGATLTDDLNNKSQTFTDTSDDNNQEAALHSLSPTQVGLIVLSAFLLLILVTVSSLLIVKYRKNRFFASNRFIILAENDRQLN